MFNIASNKIWLAVTAASAIVAFHALIARAQTTRAANTSWIALCGITAYYATVYVAEVAGWISSPVAADCRRAGGPILWGCIAWVAMHSRAFWRNERRAVEGLKEEIRGED